MKTFAITIFYDVIKASFGDRLSLFPVTVCTFPKY